MGYKIEIGGILFQEEGAGGGGGENKKRKNVKTLKLSKITTVELM